MFAFDTQRIHQSLVFIIIAYNWHRLKEIESVASGLLKSNARENVSSCIFAVVKLLQAVGAFIMGARS